ncbi:MAG: lipopolysaccharide biosynthesis protein [Methylococcales bacterium]|nr:lipopolysaccharide biosynthesis protein [Methylococcales bacterium]
MSLRNKIIKGSLWNGISQFGAQGISFVLILILARFLSPEEFGLLGMVSVITGFLGYFSEGGLIMSLIKKKEIDELDCNTAFWGGIGFGVIVYAFIYAIAPVISWFYEEPELTDLARVLGLAFLIGAYTFVPFALEQRELNYQKLSVINLVSLLISAGVAIFFVYRGAGVWTLVFQNLAIRVVTLIGTFFWIEWKPKLQFSPARFKELFGFGMHVTANNLIRFFSENIDYLLVGKLLGSEALGIYTMAFRLSRYPIEKIGPILGRMLVPAFAIIQNQPDRVQQNVLRLSAIVALITVPFSVFLFFTTEPLVTLIVGEKWLGAVPLIKIFIIYILFLSLSFADESVLIIKDKIKVLNLVKMIISIMLLLAGYFVVEYQQAGIMGMTIVYTITLSCYYIIIKLVTLNAIEMMLGYYLRSMGRLLFYSIVLFSSTYLTWTYITKNETITLLAIGSIIVIVMLLMLLPYYKIITIRPFKINIDQCLGIIDRHKDSTFFYLLFYSIILSAIVLYSYLNIMPLEPFMLAHYQPYIDKVQEIYTYLLNYILCQ